MESAYDEHRRKAMDDYANGKSGQAIIDSGLGRRRSE